MATPFLSSEDYDERAHRLYDDGEYDSALETLKEGLRLYPHSVDLYVGLGFTRLAREEYAWARLAFERGLVLDPDQEDALVGLGESLLRLGQPQDALDRFERVLSSGGEDSDLLLTMGRALYREQMYEAALQVFRAGTVAHADSAELAAGLGYALHRTGDDTGARAELRRALRLDGLHHEARIYLAHMLYDRGDWNMALAEFETVAVADHFDPLAVARVIELRRALSEEATGLREWEARLAALEPAEDPVEGLLSHLEQRAANGEFQRDDDGWPHRVEVGGVVVDGSWYEIVRQIRNVNGTLPGETVAGFMERRAAEERARSGQDLPTHSVHDFVHAGARVGLWRIER